MTKPPLVHTPRHQRRVRRSSHRGGPGGLGPPTKRTRPPASALREHEPPRRVELRGIEPLTYSMRTWRDMVIRGVYRGRRQLAITNGRHGWLWLLYFAAVQLSGARTASLPSVRTFVPIPTIQADPSRGWLGSIPRAGVIVCRTAGRAPNRTAISPGRPGLTPAGHVNTIFGQWG